MHRVPTKVSHVARCDGVDIHAYDFDKYGPLPLGVSALLDIHPLCVAWGVTQPKQFRGQLRDQLVEVNIPHRRGNSVAYKQRLLMTPDGVRLWPRSLSFALLFDISPDPTLPPELSVSGREAAARQRAGVAMQRWALSRQGELVKASER